MIDNSLVIFITMMTIATGIVIFAAFKAKTPAARKKVILIGALGLAAILINILYNSGALPFIPKRYEAMISSLGMIMILSVLVYNKKKL